MIWMFIARDTDKNGQPLPPVPPGVPTCFIIQHPGPAEALFQAINKAGFGQVPPGQVPPKYRCLRVDPNDPEFRILCVGSPSLVQLSAHHVQGGQPVGAPRNQGQNRPAGSPDFFGFENLPDDAMDASGDEMYGSQREPARTDTYINPAGPGQGHMEFERQA